MTIKPPAQLQQYEHLANASAAQTYEHLANASAAQTKEHIQQLAEVYQKISSAVYPATATAQFYPLTIPPYSEGLIVTFHFESGDVLEFDGKLSGALASFSGESVGKVTFPVSPETLVQMGSVSVSASISAGMTSISWLPLSSFMGTPIQVPPVNLWGIGTFKKV